MYRILYHYEFGAIFDLEPAYDECFMKNDYVIHNGEDITWSSDKCSVNSVTIEAGGKLTVTANVDMLCDAKVIVRRGGKLVIDGGTFTSKTQWKGIIVEGNSNEEQPNYDEMPQANEAGIVITQNDAIIENAHIGITTNYVGQWSDQYWGGVVHCEDTEFIGCWKGIEFMKYDLENSSYIGNCTFTGWKEGITIWATDGIEIENCTFDNKYIGIGFLDSKVIVQHNNTFSNCERGIWAGESIPGDSRLVVEYDNQFIDNDTAIVISGQNYSDIRDDNYFEGNDVGVKIQGKNQIDIANNFFMANNDNITSDVTGNNYNIFSCNIMTGQDKGIWYLNENLKSEFLYNDFVGTYDMDVFGLDATINSSIGSEHGAAMNLFSEIDHDLYWPDYLGNTKFIYYIPTSPTPRTDPKYAGNFTKDDGDVESGNCIELSPPIITTVILEKVIEDYCFWYHKYKENPKNGYYKKKFLKYEKKLHSYYYYWKYDKNDKKTWKEIEDILKKICGHKWKVKLFGHYLGAGYFIKADSMLSAISALKTGKGKDIPEDMSDEQIISFVEIEQINLKLQESGGKYQISDDEKESLAANTLKNIPESAYAIGTYYLATGDILSRPLPDYNDRLQYRGKKFEKPEWLVYPNPATKKLNILYSGADKSVGSLELFDIMGNKVLDSDYILKRGHKIQLNVSGLTDGIYLLHILDSNDNTIKTEKIAIGISK